jgi:hypothetical protein
LGAYTEQAAGGLEAHFDATVPPHMERLRGVPLPFRDVDTASFGSNSSRTLMGFSPPVIPKAFFAYALGSKSVGGANRAPARSHPCLGALKSVLLQR